MFPEGLLNERVLSELDEEIVCYLPPEQLWLPCGRWIARSCLQKAIRRGEVALAQQALATLLRDDPYGVWRHLAIIALEDVGAADIDLVAAVVIVGRNRRWRAARGGEWRIASFLTRKLAESLHCQAACDLLLLTLNSPALVAVRGDALEAEPEELVERLSCRQADIQERSLAAMALAGQLAEGQRLSDAAAVFERLGDQESSSCVAVIGSLAWRTTRNAMALLLPLVWQHWTKSQFVVADDVLPAVQKVGSVPGYVIDQFTRIGGQVVRSYLRQDRALASILDDAGIPPSQQPRAIGDLLFLVEGGLVSRRAIWTLGDQLRLPLRMLPHVRSLGSAAAPAAAQLKSRLGLISELRAHLTLRSGLFEAQEGSRGG